MPSEEQGSHVAAEAAPRAEGESAASPLSAPHSTILNLYEIGLEGAVGDFRAEELAHGRWSAAVSHVAHRQVSHRTEKVLGWADVVTVQGWVTIAVIALLVRAGTRRLELVPRGLQTVWEFAYQTLDGFARNAIGPTGSRYTPLLGTFFIYILCLNLFGIVPGFISATSALNQTVALALCCFAAVQYYGLRASGWRYLMHFVGEPLWLAPINIPIHVIGELARPLSLSVRLFGNIFGEDTVIAALVALGGVIFMSVKVPVPVQLPMQFFGLFGSFVQALVFTMLAAAYLAGAVRHEHGPEQGHAEPAAA